MKANEAPETYPMQFKDKIDEYLWKEHHILGGCCSSVESLKYSIAREVAENLTDAFIEKACEFINKANLYLYHCISEECDLVDTDEMIEDFRKYMKGE